MATDVKTDAREERIDGGGGLQIVVRSRQPVSPPRAVVVICHGVNSHGGQYLWTLEQLAAAGFAVYVLDLRGRGKSREIVSMSRTSLITWPMSRRSSGSPNRGNQVPSSCSATAPAASYRAPTPWTTRPSSPGSSVRALPSGSRADLVLTVVKGLSRVAPRLPGIEAQE